MRKFLPILALSFLAASCGGKKVEMDPILYDSDQVALMVKGKSMFTCTGNNCQIGFNRTLREFRAGNDDMTSYFVITCSELPAKEGQEIKADLQWTSGSSVKSSTGLTFQVEKIDAGLVWLWNATDKTGAVVKILN